MSGGLVITFKAIKPGRLNIDAVRLELLNALHAEAADHRKELAKTTSSWTGDKPTFESAVSLSGGGATVMTGPAGSTMGAKKWMWLDQGTRVRYATMSSNWRSKTKVKWFGSGGGRGKVLFVSRRRPRPGIKARGWSEALTLTRKNAFQKRVLTAMKRASEKMWAR